MDRLLLLMGGLAGVLLLSGLAAWLWPRLDGDVIGRYALAALLVGQYLGTCTDFGLGVLLTREVARRPVRSRRS